MGKVQTIPVGSQTHHLWVVNQNGQAVIMRASDPAPLNLAKDLPAGLSLAAVTKVTADQQEVIKLGNQVIQDGKAADAFAALAAAAKKAGQPAPTVPNPSPVATLVADTAKLNQAEQTLTTDLKTYKATCFYGAACFAAGTPLRTPDGSKAIEEIRVGDSVLSRSEYDPSGPVEPKVVEEVFVRIGSIWRLQVGGRSIESSGEHPFHSWEKGWVACNELKVGDLLLNESGNWSVVEEVKDTGNWATLYNLRVADWHTYFVGCEGCAVWAHNANCGPYHTLVPGTANTYDLTIFYKDGWTADQKAAADTKVAAINSFTPKFVVKSTADLRQGAQQRYRNDNDLPPGVDADHLIDLQLGGNDIIENIWPLNSSVNRSLGSSVRLAIGDLPGGTPIQKIIIKDR